MEKYIVELLYNNECVIVPGFGAFITQDQNAEIKEGYLYPKTKKVAFNPTLKSNDGLLYNEISRELGLTYNESRQYVDQKLKEWELDLEERKKVYIWNLGTLVLNEDNKLIFRADENINFEKESFGLFRIRIIEVSRKRSDIFPVRDGKTPSANYKRSKNKRILLYSLIAYIPIIFGFWFLALKDDNLSDQDVAGIKIFKESHSFSDNEVVAVPIDEEKIRKAPARDVQAIEKNEKQDEGLYELDVFHYHVVGGAFREYENAISLLNELKANSFVPQLVKKSSLYLVSYQSFSSRQEAIEYLLKIKNEVNNKAWLYNN